MYNGLSKVYCIKTRGMNPLVYKGLTGLCLLRNSKIQVLSRSKRDSQADSSALFKVGLIFKDFSRKPFIFKYFSNLCKP